MGEQLYYCYGRRTSRYLLKWYGFCDLNSKNDSYQFQLWTHEINLDNELDVRKAVFKDFVSTEEELSFYCCIIIDGKKLDD